MTEPECNCGRPLLGLHVIGCNVWAYRTTRPRKERGNRPRYRFVNGVWKLQGLEKHGGLSPYIYDSPDIAYFNLGDPMELK